MYSMAPTPPTPQTQSNIDPAMQAMQAMIMQGMLDNAQFGTMPLSGYDFTGTSRGGPNSGGTGFPGQGSYNGIQPDGSISFGPGGRIMQHAAFGMFGPVGMLANGLANTTARAASVANVNNALANFGLPTLSPGQDVGAALGFNPYGRPGGLSAALAGAGVSPNSYASLYASQPGMMMNMAPRYATGQTDPALMAPQFPSGSQDYMTRLSYANAGRNALANLGTQDPNGGGWSSGAASGADNGGDGGDS